MGWFGWLVVAVLVCIAAVYADVLLRRVADRALSDGGSQLALTLTRRVLRSRAIDHVRAGVVYGYHNGDVARAIGAFSRACVRARTEPPRDARVVLDRAADFAERTAERIAQRRPVAEEIRVNLNRLFDVITDAGGAVSRAVEPRTLDEHILNTNDTQNVHDSQVTRDMAATFGRIRSPTAYSVDRNLAAVERALHMILTSDTTAAQKASAYDVLERISGSNATISSIPDAVTGRPAAEEDVLTAVVERIEAPENSGQRDNIRDAFALALASCVEPLGIVCVSGRVSQLLGCLALLDADPRNGISHRRETIRNAAFQAAARARDDVLASVSEAERDAYNRCVDTPEMKALGERVVTAVERAAREELAQHTCVINADRIIEEARSAA